MSERPLTSLERLRETVRLRVEATSLRAVARQVGMSPSGLEKFLAGGTPYAGSRQKLQDWWEREGSRPRPEVSAQGIEVAVGALVRDLPPEFRAEAIERLIRALRDVYDEQHAEHPVWLDSLAAVWLTGQAPGAEERDTSVDEEGDGASGREPGGER
jgi:hypothetical protein